MVKRAEAYIVKSTPHGKRLFPFTLAEAEKAIKDGTAAPVKGNLYIQTATAVLPTQETRMLASERTKSKRK